MTSDQVKNDIVDGIFSGGFIMSNVLPLAKIFHIADVNEWLHFGVLLVTATLGIWKLIDKIKKKKSEEDGE